MKKLTAGSITATAGCLVFLFIAGTSPAQEQAAEKLVESKCTYCHSVKRVCRVLGERNASKWNDSVSRMVAKGLVLSENQQKSIVDYLAEVDPATAPFCKK